MMRSQARLREDMLAIWKAGVEGVLPKHLIRENVVLEEDAIWICDQEYPLRMIDHITVIGAGKASGAMAETLEQVFAPLVEQSRISGWVNVPDDCVKPLKAIHLHGARPAGLNEPTEAGLLGTSKMLELIHAKKRQPGQLVITLISGGGSALMPSLEDGITLEQKLAVTRFLSSCGATIGEINTVREQLSRLKGGGLKHECAGMQLVGLILSDVTGDPLDVIASGPTVDNTTTPIDAVMVLQKYHIATHPEFAETGKTVLDWIAHRTPPDTIPFSNANIKDDTVYDSAGGSVRNVIIGNNATAVDAAGVEAEKRGYSHAMICATEPEGLAAEIGVQLAEMARSMQSGTFPGSADRPDCLISGGEPVVQLAPAEKRGRGGRNQHLVLAAAKQLLPFYPCRIGFLSGGTDGEDGPTDAAGAFLDDAILETIRNSPQLDINDFLMRNDAYSFFETVGGLLKTGPTGTNVCDLRVIVVRR